MRGLIILLLSVASLSILGVPGTANANVNDFVIDRFHGKYELLDDTPGGRLITTETIELTYSDNNHGILRSIPKDSNGRGLSIRILSVTRDGYTEHYETYEDNNNLVIRIGHPDRTVTGSHSYEINYDLRGGIVGQFESFDEWYWDINGTDWEQPFRLVEGELILPASAKASGLSEKVACYTGAQGASANGCTIRQTETGYEFTTNYGLEPGQNLSIAIALNDGVFRPYATLDWVKDNILNLAWLILIPASFIFCFSTWQKFGKDHIGKGVIYPEYDPPKGMTPAEVGLVMDYSINARDLSATVIDLATRGFIRIIDDNKTYLSVLKTHDLSLELLKSDFSTLKKHEADILRGIFERPKVGQIIRQKKIEKTGLRIYIARARKQLTDELTSTYGVIDPGANRYQASFISVGLLSLTSFIFLRNPLHLIAVGFSAAIFIGFGSIMRRRTHSGVEAYEHAVGLKLYMKTAEVDRYKMMQSVNRPYNEPNKNYEFFEKLLPYAVALGVEKSWAKQFDGLFKESPEWYKSANYAALDSSSFASSLTNGISSMNRSFSSHTIAPTSGSGGSGLSGGGGGGGGGGGW
jgi:uncharacterized membrane protein YgcG